MSTFTIKSLEGKLILTATILASGMAFLDGTVVNIAVPAIQSKLHATLSDIQWIINGYALMLSALILISGAVSDRFGRKKIFTLGIALFTLSSLLCGISQNVTQLILFRLIQGIGASMMIPGSLSIINIAFEKNIRGQAIGLWSGFAGGVAAAGPFIGGWLVQTLGWQSVFFINIPIGILALFITLKYVPESKSDEAGKIDFVGTVLIFLGLLTLIYALISGPVDGWSSSIIVSSLIAGFVFCALFVYSQIKNKYSLVPTQIFKSPLVTGANIVTLFLYFALYGVIFFLVLNVQQVQHLSPLLSGLAMLPTILIITFLSGPGGQLADKIGPRIPMIFGPLIVSIGMALLVIPGRNANYFTLFLPGLILFGLGMSLVIAPLTKSALSVDHKYSGAASGVNNAVSRIAGLLAVALLGAIIASIFTNQLRLKLNASTIPISQKQIIMSQSDRLGGIELPSSFNPATKTIAQIAIEDAFVYAFRIAIATCAALAFLSAVVAFILIRERK